MCYRFTTPLRRQKKPVPFRFRRRASPSGESSISTGFFFLSETNPLRSSSFRRGLGRKLAPFRFPLARKTPCPLLPSPSLKLHFGGSWGCGGYKEMPVNGSKALRADAPFTGISTWGGIWGSNPRHPEPQSGALPTELIPPYFVN